MRDRVSLINLSHKQGFLLLAHESKPLLVPHQIFIEQIDSGLLSNKSFQEGSQAYHLLTWKLRFLKN
jgi:hypothetical protein